jgi:hypothetical protein
MVSCDDVARAVELHGSINKAAAALGVSRTTAQNKIKQHRVEVESLPDPDLPVADLIARRASDYERRAKAALARRLVNVKVKEDGPIGICFFGDPHLDDDGTDIGLAFEHARIVAKAPAMYGMNVGDNQNNWIGRLARLYANQSTTAQESWRIAEEFLKIVTWLALVKGNHDSWTGAGDPIDWILRDTGTYISDTDVRLGVNFKNGRQCRIWMRHNFNGTSIWNTLHGLMRAAQQGNDFHIFACGHHHTAAHHVEFSPEMGHAWHALRVGGYKILDHYAAENGLRAQNRMPSGVFVIDPDATTDMGFCTFIPDVEAGADYLKFMRRKRVH